MKNFIINESERKRILNMHNSKKNLVTEATATDLQNLLNSKHSAGLKPDGNIGNMTLTAIEKALGISSGGQGIVQGAKAALKNTTAGTPEQTAKATTGTPSQPPAETNVAAPVTEI